VHVPLRRHQVLISCQLLDRACRCTAHRQVRADLRRFELLQGFGSNEEQETDAPRTDLEDVAGQRNRDSIHDRVEAPAGSALGIATEFQNGGNI
jgi:hypothetical protein